MFGPFNIFELIWPTIAIFTITTVVTFAATKNIFISTIAAVIKSGIYFIYFGFIFDGTYTLVDDKSYISISATMLENGLNPSDIWHNWVILKNNFGSNSLYYMYNAVAFLIFGSIKYFSPVALNVILTSFIALLGSNLIKSELAITTNTSKGYFLFLLLYPDIVAWSSIINIKDILVLLFHILFLIAIAKLLKQRFWPAILITAITLPLTLYTRYYIILPFTGSLLLFAIYEARLKPNKSLNMILCAMISIILIGLIYLQKGIGAFTFPIHVIESTFVNPIYGFIRFLLTPIPFNTEKAYAFLNIPATFNWILLPFLFIGIYKVWNMHTRFGQFLIIYFSTFLFMYAITGEVQGPRHRIQLDFVISTFQFLGLVATYGRLRTRTLSFYSRNL